MLLPGIYGFEWNSKSSIELPVELLEYIVLRSSPFAIKKNQLVIALLITRWFLHCNPLDEYHRLLLKIYW